MKSFPGVRNRWMFRIVATAAAALALPVAALAAPASGAAARAGGTGPDDRGHDLLPVAQPVAAGARSGCRC